MASTFVLILILVMIGVIMFIAWGYMVDAAVKIAHYPNYSTDANLSSAHVYLSWSATIIILCIVAVVAAVIFLLVEGAEVASRFSQLILILLLLFVIAVTIAIGVISSMSASYLNASSATTGDPALVKAYDDCVISAVITLGAVGLAIIVGIMVVESRRRAAARMQTAKEMVAKYNAGEHSQKNTK